MLNLFHRARAMVALFLACALVIEPPLASGWPTLTRPEAHPPAPADFSAQALSYPLVFLRPSADAPAKIRAIRWLILAGAVAGGAIALGFASGNLPALHMTRRAMLNIGLPVLFGAGYLLSVFLPSSPPPPPPVQEFIDKVIRPVSGELPPSLSVSVHPRSGELMIEHREEQIDPTGHHHQVDFRYRIEWNGRDVQTPKHPSLTEVNTLQAPKGPWDADTIKELQYAWRRITIADPVLYRRFSSETLELTPYEEEAVEAVLTSVHSTGRALTVMATGTGKTIVAFETLRRLREQRLKAIKQGEDPGAAVFFVNNLTVLEEAEAALAKHFPGQFRVGRIYEGKTTGVADADIIFATTSSLLTDESVDEALVRRIDDLMQKRKIAAVVSDEVHHLPAATYREVFRTLTRRDSRVPFLGFTATEVRRDDANVRDFFGNRTAFLYSYESAYHEGYLVDMDYQTGDAHVLKSLFMEKLADTLFSFFPERTLAYKRKRYEPESSLPALLDDLKRRSAALNDPKSLILCRNIAHAHAVADYFSANGIPTESLTSEDRGADAVRFSHSYEALKHGAWPEGGNWPAVSPYRGERVPQAAAAVNIFREGIDAPAINLLYLWTDTESPLAFVQMIGRGLRPAPFKTHLTIVDAVGIQRQDKFVLYMKYLRRASERDIAPMLGHRPAFVTPGAPQAPLVQPPAVPPRPASGVQWDIPTGEISFHLDSGEPYERIPAPFLKTLDDFIAYRMGFIRDGQPDVAALQAHLNGLAAQLGRPGALAEVANRTRMRAPFYLAFRYLNDPALRYVSIARDPLAELYSYTIQNTPASRVVFNRIADLLTHAPQPASLDQVLDLFFEFQPDTSALIGRRAETIHATMFNVFGVGYSRVSKVRALTRHLARVIIDDRPPESLTDPLEQLLLEQADVAEDGDTGDLLLLKALGERTRQGKVYAPDIIELQQAMIQIYLRHPCLQGRLKTEDFELPHEKFLALLKERSLIRRADDLQRLYPVLVAALKAYEDAAKHPVEEGRLARTQLNVEEILDIHQNIGLSESIKLSRGTMSTLTGWTADLERVRRRLAPEHVPGHDRLAGKYKAFVDRVTQGRTLTETTVANVQVKVEWGDSRTKRTNPSPRLFRITVQGAGRTGIFGVHIEWPIAGRTHAAILTERYQTIIPEVSELERLYAELPETDRRAVIRQVCDAMQTAVAEAVQEDQETVYLVPEDPAGEEEPGARSFFFRDLQDSLLDAETHPPAYVIGPLRRPDAKTRKAFVWDFAFTAGTEARSRFPELTQGEADGLRDELVRAAKTILSGTAGAPLVISALPPEGGQFGHRTFRDNVNALYLSSYNLQQDYGPAWERVRQRLETLPGDRESFITAVYLLARMDWTATYYPHVEDFRSAMHDILGILDAGDATEPPSDLQIGISFLRLVTAIGSLENPWNNTMANVARTCLDLFHEQAQGQRFPPTVEAILEEVSASVLRSVQRYVGSGRLSGWAAYYPDESLQMSLWLRQLRQALASLQSGKEGAAAAPAVQAGPPYRIAFSGNDLVLFNHSLLAKRQVSVDAGPRGAGKKIEMTKMVNVWVAHVDPQCRAIAASRRWLTRRDYLFAKAQGEEFIPCPLCEHGLPGYRPGTPDDEQLEEIEQRFRGQGRQFQIDPAGPGPHSDLLGHLLTFRPGDAALTFLTSLFYPVRLLASWISGRQGPALDADEVSRLQQLGRRLGFDQVLVRANPWWRFFVDASIDFPAPGVVRCTIQPLLPRFIRLKRFLHEINHLRFRRRMAGASPASGLRVFVARLDEERWVTRQTEHEVAQAVRRLDALSPMELAAEAARSRDASVRQWVMHFLARIRLERHSAPRFARGSA